MFHRVGLRVGAQISEGIFQRVSLGIEVWEGYGITECSPLIAVDVYYHSKPGSVGPAVTSCMVRIEDAVTDEDGHDIGEICVKGKKVMLG